MLEAKHYRLMHVFYENNHLKLLMKMCLQTKRQIHILNLLNQENRLTSIV